MKEQWRNKCEISKKSQVFGFTRKIFDDFHFQGFPVVVVTLFVESFTISTIFFGMCVFPKENRQPIFGVTFFRGKETISIGRETKTNILPTKINETMR